MKSDFVITSLKVSLFVSCISNIFLLSTSPQIRTRQLQILSDHPSSFPYNHNEYTSDPSTTKMRSGGRRLVESKYEHKNEDVSFSPSRLRKNPELNQENNRNDHRGGRGNTSKEEEAAIFRINGKKSSPSINVPFRMLLGIFSTNTLNDFTRRSLIRRTYLSYYHTLNQANVTGQWTNRICALADIMAGNATNADECQLVYTFVTGGADPSDSNARTELLGNDPNVTITLDEPYLDRQKYQDWVSSNGYNDEHDVIHLNIKENMNEGKTVTWFKYASSYLPDDLQIDLIAKVDTDTIVFPPSLLNEVERQLRAKDNLLRPLQLVYGGHKISDHHYYIQGGFYFLSQDLARYITSDKCPRDEIVQAHMEKHGYRAEDREIGAFVKRRERSPDEPKAQRLYLPFEVGSAHYKRLKDPQGFRVKWKEFFAKQVATLKYQQILSTVQQQSTQQQDESNEANNEPTVNIRCPPVVEINDILGQFDRGTNVKRAKEEFLKLVDKACKLS